MPGGSRKSPGPVGVEVAAILREARARLDLSQAQLAQRAEISQSQTSAYLRGARSPSLEEYAALCRTLRLDVAEVMREAEARASSRSLPPGVAREVARLERDARPSE